MKHASLFSGIGGFDLAAQMVGFENVFQIEIDDFCQKILKKNFPNVIKYRDVKNVYADIDDNLLQIIENGDVFMGAKRLAKYDDCVNLYTQGLSIEEIANFFGITRQAMHKILKRRGCIFRSNLQFENDNHFFRDNSSNDKKKRVQHIVEKAIKKCILERPTICSVCGNKNTFSDGRNGIQAHHSDYDKPLDVIWLCQHCHYEWHINNKAINDKDNYNEKGDKGSPRTGRIDVLSGGFP